MLSMLLACEARDPRRERRWQIHAHQDAGWRHPAFIRRTLSRRQENRAGKSRRRAPPWHRDGLPRNQLGSFADRRSKSLPKRRQAVQSPPGNLHRRPAIPAVAQLPVDPAAVVSSLGAGQKQMVEIARAVHHNAQIIIFDEPTGTPIPKKSISSSRWLLGSANAAYRLSSSPMPSRRLCKSRIGSRSCVTANM